MTYNTRLQPASFTVPGVVSKTYDYQADGRLKFSHNLTSPVFDRSYAHDHAGRISEALSGAEARNEGTTNNRPYKQNFVYDALGHLTERPVNKLWSEQGGVFSPAQQTYVNERNTAWTYDADGNLTDSGAVDSDLRQVKSEPCHFFWSCVRLISPGAGAGTYQYVMHELP